MAPVLTPAQQMPLPLTWTRTDLQSSLVRNAHVPGRDGNVIPWELIENQITATHDYEVSPVTLATNLRRASSFSLPWRRAG